MIEKIKTAAINQGKEVGILVTLFAYIITPFIAACFREANLDIGVANATLWRFIIGIIILIPFLKKYHITGLIHTKQKFVLLTRAIVGGAAVGLYFLALGNLNLGVAVVLSLSVPLFIPLIAYFVNQEKATIISVVLVILGFIGAYLIATDSNEITLTEINITQFIFIGVGLLSAALSALSLCLNRLLSKNHSNNTLLINFLIGGLIVSLIWCSFTGFQLPSVETFILLLIAAFLANLQQILAVYASKELKTEYIAAFSYISVPITIAFGYIVYNETISPVETLGVIVIVATSLIQAYRTIKDKK